MSEQKPQGGSYDDFINAVWIFESDIDPAKQDFYNHYWELRTTLSYPRVLSPGRVVRDEDGNPIMQDNLTIKELFTIIGVDSLYDPSNPKPDWAKIQASVINYLGFVGFQFQESDLQTLGYYNFTEIPAPASSDEGIVLFPVHYVDVDPSYWKAGRSIFFSNDPALVSTPTWITDTVYFFDGNFTGKNGISSNADFRDPSKQILIIKDHFANKYQGIVDGLKARGKQLSDYLNTKVYWDKLDPPVPNPPSGLPNEVTITLSGLLAGAHLRGAGGVVSLLVDGKNPQDESGTYILQYVQSYAGYDTPFKS